jgi:hypothetical protein
VHLVGFYSVLSLMMHGNMNVKKDIHPYTGGIQTHNPSKGAVADLLFRPRGHLRLALGKFNDYFTP